MNNTNEMEWSKLWKKSKKMLKTEKGMVIAEKYQFPCSSDNCLVRAACTKPCEKLVMDDEGIRELFNEHKACPDCGSSQFYEGPSGGMTTNMKCAGCGHWFNVGLPLFVQRIHISEGRFHR